MKMERITWYKYACSAPWRYCEISAGTITKGYIGICGHATQFMSMSIAHITIKDFVDFPDLSTTWDHADAQELNIGIPSPIGCGTLESWIHSSLLVELMEGPSPHLTQST